MPFAVFSGDESACLCSETVFAEVHWLILAWAILILGETLALPIPLDLEVAAVIVIVVCETSAAPMRSHDLLPSFLAPSCSPSDALRMDHMLHHRLLQHIRSELRFSIYTGLDEAFVVAGELFRVCHLEDVGVCVLPCTVTRILNRCSRG